VNAPIWRREVIAKLAALVRRRRDDVALDDEIALHLTLMGKRLRVAGVKLSSPAVFYLSALT